LLLLLLRLLCKLLFQCPEISGAIVVLAQ